MQQNQQAKHILIIERQPYWRKLSECSLAARGFQVDTLENYDYPTDLKSKAPDLVILGCSNIGSEEQQLIAKLLENKQNLLVLCTSLPLPVMRSLFIAGAKDVTDKPYDPEHVINVVEEALRSISQHSSYHAEREGGQ